MRDKNKVLHLVQPKLLQLKLYSKDFNNQKYRSKKRNNQKLNSSNKVSSSLFLNQLNHWLEKKTYLKIKQLKNRRTSILNKIERCLFYRSNKSHSARKEKHKWQTRKWGLLCLYPQLPVLTMIRNSNWASSMRGWKTNFSIWCLR